MCLSGVFEAGSHALTGFCDVGDHLVVIQQDEPLAVGALNRCLAMCVFGYYGGLLRTAGVLNDPLDSVRRDSRIRGVML